MKCPKCGSEHVNAQVVSEQVYVEKGHHGLLYYLFIGWWIWIFKLLLLPFTLLGRPSRKYTNTRHHTECVCQNCGYHWAKR